MLPKLIEAKYLGDYRIELSFADGTSGAVDLESELWGEMFESLKDKKEFAAFYVDSELNTLVWPNGADFAPEFLYQQLVPKYQLKTSPKSGAA